MTALTNTIDSGYTAPSNINVYFLDSSLFTDPDGYTFQSANWFAYEQDQAELAFAQYSAVADVNFNVVTDLSQADFVMVLGDDFDLGGAPGDWFTGGGLITVDSVDYFVDGVGVFNYEATGWDAAGLEVGGFGFVTLLHEIGHGLGLAHPHDAEGSSTIMAGVFSPWDLGAFDLNQGVYTTMSYNDGWQTAPHGGSPSDNYGLQGTPMALDIAVLQDIYGANTSTNLGNTVYVLPDDNAPGTYYEAIWDAGGVDTISYSGIWDAVIDLRPATLQYERGGGGFISYVEGTHGGYTIANGVVIENAFGGSGDDLLIGNDFANVLAGGSGHDEIYGGGGNDSLYGGAGDDYIAGGFGADLIYGGIGNDILAGGGGNDSIFGGDGNDALYGGDGDDILSGQGGADVIYGGFGNDLLAGGDGNDSLFGGANDDDLYGGIGDDDLFGEAGADVIFGGAGHDLLAGGDGDDDLFGGSGNDELYGGNGDDFVFGEAGNDIIYGGSGHDILGGGEGDDDLFGGAGNDQLYGGPGSDILAGGPGNDWLQGGAGVDYFVFQPGGGYDVVADFQDDIDFLDFSLFGFASEAAVIDLASQSGGNVYFDLPGGETVQVNSFTLAQLDAGDILI